MATPRPLHLALSVVTFVLMLPALLSAEQAGPGISRALAAARAQRVSNLRYDLSFTLAEHAATIPGSGTVEFDSRTGGDLLIDYRDGSLQAATLNDHAISTQLDQGHLHIPARAGRNVLRVSFLSYAAPAGKAFTRYADKDDGSEYIYTLFVPMDANMAFPCFDQPDLKAEFTLAVQHPAGWTVIGNAAPHTLDATHTRFDATRRISTYLFAFAAGPFAVIPAQNASSPAIYVRKSQRQRAVEEAPQVQSMAERGIAYFSDFFAQPFPFPKYDLVLIPGFPFGGMEHAGATFLNEDGVLFRSTSTPSDCFRRNTLVLHETCHQCFGDLVTMRWFDDLWLKEGFAQYMAYRALAELEPASQAWKHFYEDIKPLAYGIDETLGTTPIYQDIPNLKDAKSAYGAIVYEKAPAVLKQLEFRIGPEVFRDGLRLYLKQHAYGNAEWNDLISAFEQARRDSSRKNSGDVHAWAQAWIRHRGIPQVDASWSCANGKLARLVLSQHDVLPDGFLWPISNQVELHSESESRIIRVDWSTASTTVKEAIGQGCPVYIYTNAGDEAYGRFLLDAKSEEAAAKTIAGTAPDRPDRLDALLQSMLWGALWDNVRLALSPPRPFLNSANEALPRESD